MQAHPIILGTAGHIDHGKTALVRALTGIDTDRLKVEKERGITTELGFAHLDVDGRRFGVVDVPGHERFIKAMVAGAAGLDLVCLVIAADEGIMPQTREHLDICQLLGVRRGVVALTKRDLVDPEWLELVTADVRAGLEGTFLGGAPIVPLSVVTGDGLGALRQVLVAATADLPARSPAGSFRLPIDRVFTIKGFGTVVTGTVISGTVTTGDDLLTLPRGQRAKVRGLEVHGESADEARAGVRCAVNLSGVSTEELARGDVLVHPDAIAPSHIIDARFRYLPTSRGPLKTRTRVLLHHGTAQRLASLVLVDPESLEPGEEALAQLRLDADEALAALPGDRFIARGFVVQEHYGTTIGGGEIVRVQAPKVRRRDAAAAATISALSRAVADERVALEVRSRRSAGATAVELAQSLGHGSSELGEVLVRLVESGELVAAGSDSATVYVHAVEIAHLEAIAADAIVEFHRAHPQKRGIPKAALRGELPASTPGKVFEEILAGLARRGAAEIDRDIVRKPGMGSVRSPLEEKISRAFRDWGNTPERPKEVARSLGEDPAEVDRAVERLLTLGVLVKVRPDLIVHAEPLAELRERLLSHLGDRGQITPAEWKEITGASRKFSIPLAEYFDKEKLTLRVGDIRKRRG